MFDITNVYEPVTLTEALQQYDENPNLRIIAGGSDVLIHLHHGSMEKVELLSLRKITDLFSITILEEGTISIGAMVSFSELFKNEIIKQFIPILAEAAVSMGGPQVRNMATIGGNVCNGAVSADSAPSLFALNASLRLESSTGVRIIPIQDFYEGPGKVKLLASEILTHILITKENYVGMSGKYIKFSNRKAMDIAMISVASVVKVEEGRFKDLRLALGVAAPTPIRCQLAEEYAIGKPIEKAVIKDIAQLALRSAKARDSWRGSKAYREHLIQILSIRAIEETLKRSGVMMSD